MALGDSYSAGTGGGFYGTSGWCYRSANAYPNIWKNNHSVSSFKFPACAGATTGTLKANQLGQLSSSTTMVSYNKRIAINDMANTLHNVISSRAAAAGFRYVDVRAHLDPHKICSADPWILGKGWGVQSYHPNSDGYHEGYYPMLKAVTG